MVWIVIGVIALAALWVALDARAVAREAHVQARAATAIASASAAKAADAAYAAQCDAEFQELVDQLEQGLQRKTSV